MSIEPSINLVPVTYADIDALVQISADSFVEDSHTQVKSQGRKPFDMAASARSDLLRNLSIERCAYMKAVDQNTSEILGYCGWGFRVGDNGLVPRSDPGKPPAEGSSEAAPETEKEKEDEGEEDSITRLMVLEDTSMRQWMTYFMPDKHTRCMYILGLSVAPSAQGKGVGSALAKWGMDAADRLGLFTWVQSSEEAWRFYAKHGFEVAGMLDLDLDEWALRPPERVEGGEEAKWGHYVLRYMKRLPVATG
jgi:ribosomal protein S18 acetylase RimI-like enzyme